VFWLLGLTVILFVFALSSAAPCLNLLLMPVTGAVYLGLMGIYFTQAAQVGLEDDGSWPKPRWSLPNQQDILFRGGALVVVSILLFFIPAGLSFKGAPKSWVYAAGLIPYAYWPMALTVSGLRDSLVSLFNPIDIGKGLLAGGLPYVVVVLFGFFSYAGLSLLPSVASAASPGAVIGAVGVMAAGVGYIAGVQGYLMGRLVNSRPEKFEGLC
jgi:hypothetical protein